MSEPAETQLANYENLVLTDQGIRQHAKGDGVQTKAFIPTHAIADYQETSSQSIGLAIWALLLFGLLVLEWAQPGQFISGFLMGAKLHEMPLIVQYRQDIGFYFFLAVLLTDLYLFFRFFKTRYHSVKIHSSSGFSISEVTRSFLFFPKATEFLGKLEAQIRASHTR